MVADKVSKGQKLKLLTFPNKRKSRPVKSRYVYLQRRLKINFNQTVLALLLKGQSENKEI